MSATAGDGEFQLPSACTHSLSPSLVVLSSLCSPFSPGIFCILSVLCNASPQHRQTGSSVFLLHSSVADCYVNVCGEKSEREYVLPGCMCVHVCVSVLQSSVAMAMLGTWLRQLRGPALPESCCRKPLSHSCEGIHTYTHTQTHTHTNTFLPVIQRLTDG